MKTKLSFLLLFTLFVLVFTFSGWSQKQSNEVLFRSYIVTAPNSFADDAEGPAVDKEGNLYAVNYDHDGTIGKITPTGIASIFIELPKGSIGNGIRFTSKGDMLVADRVGHKILKIDMATKQVTVLAFEPRMSEPNDIAIDRKDRVYASDPNWKANTGNIWRIDPDGKITLADSNLGTVNGIEISPNDKILYVNFQRKVWAYDINKQGLPVNRRDVIEFTDYGMDGMRCDIEGNLYIARYGKGTVVKVSPTGIVLQEIQLTGKRPTNVAFGGEDGRTVYVTLQDQKNIEAFRTDIPGREWQIVRGLGNTILSKIKL